jgi:uncharacterized protein (DUF2235 family)
MAKRIALCCDGTWDNTASNTNVFRLFNSIRVSATQMPFYDTGVGSDGNPLERLFGGAFGNGLFQKIKDGYTKIAHIYEQDDELFLFGFSRGAYTARSIAGMITACGLPTKNFSEDLVNTAFDAYRNKDKRAALLATLNNCSMYPAKITMLGVWDTVGSLGIPAIFGGIDPLRYGFLDTGLNPNVLHAYHALAIDERRRAFPPTLWNSPAVPGQTIEQVWFSGVHCDVGGGYPSAETDSGSALSDITLGWMMQKATALGLDLDPAALKSFVPLQLHFALDAIHESWKPFWGFPTRRTIPPNSSLSNTVLARFTHDTTYRPQNLRYESGVWDPTCALSQILESLDPDSTIAKTTTALNA